MGKSLRSKIKRRYRNLKRRYINQIKVKPETEELNAKCQKSLLDYNIDRKNDLLHPEDPDAISHNTSSHLSSISGRLPSRAQDWSGREPAERRKRKYST
jgi:hypothetical protein